MASESSVPFTVIGGYLGAGKTTLLNALVRSGGGQRLAVIVNDFGDIGIDADLIVGHDGDTVNLANGCICCSISDGLVTVLDGLQRRRREIDHVIVEASGVSDPVRIGDHATPFGFDLRGIVVLADAEQVRHRSTDKYVGSTVVGQLRGADLLVLTKTDLVSRQGLGNVRGWLEELVPDTPIVEAANGQLSSAITLGDLDVDHRSVEPAEAHAVDYVTWRGTSVAPIDRLGLDAFLAALPAEVLRAKGIVRFVDEPDRRHVVHMVGTRSTITGDSPGDVDETTRLVLIGIPGTIDPADLDRRWRTAITLPVPGADTLVIDRDHIDRGVQ